jgi:hypothetical protein
VVEGSCAEDWVGRAIVKQKRRLLRNDFMEDDSEKERRGVSVGGWNIPILAVFACLGRG